MSWSTSELRVRLALWNRFSLPVKYFLTVQRRYFFWELYMFFCLVFAMPLFICALRSPAGKGLTSWLSFVVSKCEFVTFPLVSWVRCGTWLYWFLIFAHLLSFFFLYTFTIKCVTTGAQKCILENYMICFICSKQCIKIISWLVLFGIYENCS